jgi:predicted HicB family RNase H-like nuclease
MDALVSDEIQDEDEELKELLIARESAEEFRRLQLRRRHNRLMVLDALKNETLRYKGFFGTVDFDNDSNSLYGEVINTRDTIVYRGESVEELRKDFEGAIDDYIDYCEELGEIPEKDYSGKFTLRIPTELHRILSILAKSENVSLNELVNHILGSYLRSIE